MYEQEGKGEKASPWIIGFSPISVKLSLSGDSLADLMRNRWGNQNDNHTTNSVTGRLS
jgi:hypothetical protein